MTFGILVFPGAHGDRDLKRVLEEHYRAKVVLVRSCNSKLDGIDVLLIPGGFPCKGSSTSNSCLEDSPAIDSMKDFAARGGILVGIGNGFRVLCETALVPGSLRMNKSRRFICRNTFVKPDNSDTVLTSALSADLAYRLPLATGYGRYVAKEDDLVQMRLNEQILFRFCDEFGVISESNNLTGSVDNIAGVCNEKKNVFGILPQPERAVFKFAKNTDGQGLFDSILARV